MTCPKKRQLLIPQYMHKFKCIGSDCEDTCCIGWNVLIEKKTYKKYRNCKNQELKQLLTKKINRNRTNPSDTNYAKIEMEKGSICPFLSENKLCKIQLILGKDYLSTTCDTYPRSFNFVNGILEKSLTMSCPEAVRMALLNHSPMEFDYIEEHYDLKKIIYTEVDTKKNDTLLTPQKYFWEFRIFTIDLLQNRKYELWQRLIILGLFFQKISDYINNKKIEEIPQLIASYSNNISQGNFKEFLEGIPNKITIQMEVLKELADEKFAKGVNSKRYKKCYDEFLQGINYNRYADIEEIATNYKNAYNHYYLPFILQHEYILENYLVNYVFKDLFPLGKHKDYFANYVMLVIHYAMIKMHLIGISGYYKEDFNIDHVVTTIQAFAKAFEHNYIFQKHIYELLEKNRFTTLAHMSIMIKN